MDQLAQLWRGGVYEARFFLDVDHRFDGRTPLKQRVHHSACQ